MAASSSRDDVQPVQPEDALSEDEVNVSGEFIGSLAVEVASTLEFVKSAGYKDVDGWFLCPLCVAYGTNAKNCKRRIIEHISKYHAIKYQYCPSRLR